MALLVILGRRNAYYKLLHHSQKKKSASNYFFATFLKLKQNYFKNISEMYHPAICFYYSGK